MSWPMATGASRATVKWREIPSAVGLGFKSGDPTLSTIDMGVLSCGLKGPWSFSVAGAILYIVGYCAASLVSTPRMPVATPRL